MIRTANVAPGQAPVNLDGWLATREPPPPAELRERVRLLAGGAGAPGDDRAEALIAAARRALDGLIATGSMDRASALDLLAVDALVTYAFEAAAATPAMVPSMARDAMASLSASAP